MRDRYGARGRLTVLANIVGQEHAAAFPDFEGDMDPDSIEGSGRCEVSPGRERRFSNGGRGRYQGRGWRPIRAISSCNPVVEGITRPKQDRLGDALRQRVIPLLIHGDAAMAGQGVVCRDDQSFAAGRVMKLAARFNYRREQPDRVHGESAGRRSSTYCTDVALMVQAPILHVNGDDPEACVRATQLAYAISTEVSQDVVIDVVCYRKHGHNETDDPSYTQPLMYRKIRAQKPVATLYADRLQQERLTTPAEVAQWRESNKQRLREIYDQAQLQKEQYELQELGAIPAASITPDNTPTAVDRALLDQITAGITTFPGEFHLHPKLAA
jgi:2-oxoglutarate dehydrogenase E1 component